METGNSEGLRQLEGRLAQLERKNRRLQRLAFAGLSLFVGALLMGQAAQPREEPRVALLDALVIRDAAGEPRIQMGVNQNGEAFLMMKDKTEQPQLVLSAQPRGSELRLRGDGSVNNIVRLAAGNDGTSGITLGDKSGVTRLALVLKDNDKENQATLAILDPQQTPVFVAPAQEE